MTREKAIDILEYVPGSLMADWDFDETCEALKMAIDALEAQDRPIICPRCGRTFSEAEGRESEE